MAAPIGNKYAVGNNGGRPPIYSSVDELLKECEGYFEYIKGDLKEEKEVANAKTGNIQIIQIWNREPEPATITGLALYLGFCGRKTLDDYADKDEFGYIIKRAKSFVENSYEKNLYSMSATGAIFALKNMGWADKTESTVKNLNYNSTELTPEKIKEIDKELENNF